MHTVQSSRGFVLVTALIMLSLLSLLSLAMFYASRSGSQTSATATTTTEATYYAETAIHYISWALTNDAEFDNATYTGTYQASPFGEPNVAPTDPVTDGDFNELRFYLWDPGPIGVAGSGASDSNGSDYTSGQLMYFDNSPLGSRYVCMQDAATFPNCIDITVDPKNRVTPVMENISAKLPRYIKLEISDTGVITPSIPKLPHHSSPIAGQDIPNNGAIVWLTAVETSDPDRDIQIYPLDPSTLNGGSKPEVCATLGTCPCKAPATLDPLQPYSPDPADPQYNFYIAAQACNANPHQSDNPADLNYLPTTDPNYVSPWLPTYGVVAYAIGYVNGKPSHLMRAVIM